jgi:O-succinylbenzoic acid--CoA ligase
VPDLVAIDLPGGDGFVAALQTVWARGDAALPLDQRLSTQAQAAVLDQLRPGRVIDGDGEHRRHHGRPVLAGDALVMATSGTTGAAKGVILTHDAVAASAQATSSRLGVDPARHRWLACLPLNHVGGLGVLTRSLITDTPVTVLPGFDAAEVTRHSGPDTFVSLVATALQRVDPGRFHTVVLGGAAPPAERAANVVTTYGLTETGSGVVYEERPLDGVDIEVDPVTNEIRLRGPMLLRAYRTAHNPAADDPAATDGATHDTTETATGDHDPKDADGWFATGDAGHLDAEGRLHVHGRLGDLIISGGENVWPTPVEAALKAHPKVAEAAVAGRPDPEWGQRVVAWVVPADPSQPPTLAELRAAVAEAVAPFASPRQLIIVAHFPRTSLGKVRKENLPTA